jgi:hypothetical protein
MLPSSLDFIYVYLKEEAWLTFAFVIIILKQCIKSVMKYLSMCLN